jgi:carbamoyltransferase
MKILGISGVLGHDASAALLIDGKIIAAAEEERFMSEINMQKIYSQLKPVGFVCSQANISPSDIDIVTFPYAKIPFFSKARWHYARRYWYAPDRSLDAIFNGNQTV